MELTRKAQHTRVDECSAKCPRTAHDLAIGSQVCRSPREDHGSIGITDSAMAERGQPGKNPSLHLHDGGYGRDMENCEQLERLRGGIKIAPLLNNARGLLHGEVQQNVKDSAQRGISGRPSHWG